MRYFLLIFLTISLSGYSQCKTSIIGPRGDVLNCIDYNGKKQGKWVNTMPALRGEPGYEEQGIYIDDKKEGRWQQFSLMGDLMAIENYRWGNKDGKCYYYTRFGQPLREESWKAVNPDNPYDSVEVYDLKDPTKVTEKVLVKLDGYSLKHGVWKFYDPEFGTVEKTDVYHLDKLRNEMDDLAPIDIKTGGNSKTDTATVKKIAKPQVVLDYEKKNAGKKSIKVRDGRTGN